MSPLSRSYGSVHGHDGDSPFEGEEATAAVAALPSIGLPSISVADTLQLVPAAVGLFLLAAGVIVYRIDDRVFFANASYVKGRVREAVRGAPTRPEA